MKIKIVEPGNEGFTGHLGNVQFFGGMSTHEVSEAAAAGIAAIYRIERVGADVEQDQAPQEEVTSEEQNTEQAPQEQAEVTSEEQTPAAE